MDKCGLDTNLIAQEIFLLHMETVSMNFQCFTHTDKDSHKHFSGLKKNSLRKEQNVINHGQSIIQKIKKQKKKLKQMIHFWKQQIY